MDSHGEQTHFTKRVTLPSGKTIEVVYFAEDARAAEAQQDLHVCVDCDSDLV